MTILQSLINRSSIGQKSIAVLIDPDKHQTAKDLTRLIGLCVENKVNYLFVGGSLLTNDHTNMIISTIKNITTTPVLLFPGSSMHLDLSADGILLLSLISGRNPELLIGQHVLAAPIIKKSTLEVISTGYMLIGNGNDSTVSYMSNTIPIPTSKTSVAVCTAMAGEMLGLKTIYLEAGSGAAVPVPSKMIKLVKNSVSVPLIVGGGLNSPEKAIRAIQSGADLIVLGNGIEENPDLLIQVSEEINMINQTLDIH